MFEPKQGETSSSDTVSDTTRRDGFSQKFWKFWSVKSGPVFFCFLSLYSGVWLLLLLVGCFFSFNSLVASVSVMFFGY